MIKVQSRKRHFQGCLHAKHIPHTNANNCSDCCWMHLCAKARMKAYNSQTLRSAWGHASPLLSLPSYGCKGTQITGWILKHSSATYRDGNICSLLFVVQKTKQAFYSYFSEIFLPFPVTCLSGRWAGGDGRSVITLWTKNQKSINGPKSGKAVITFEFAVF